MDNFSTNKPSKFKLKHRQNSYESIEEYCSNDRITSCNQTIFERTTNEMSISNNTRNLFNNNKDCNTSTTSNKNLKSPITPTTIVKETEKNDYKVEKSLTGMSQYHQNDIRLYTRYDDNFLINEKKSSKRQKIFQEHVTTKFPTIHDTNLFNNNKKKNCWMDPSYQSTSHFLSSPKSSDIINNKEDTFSTQYFPHTLTPPYSSQWRNELEEDEESYHSEYNYEKKSYNTNAVNRRSVPFDSAKNITDPSIVQKQQNTPENNFYTLLDSEKKSLLNDSSILKTNQNLRLIDYKTYCHEIDQLQHESIDYQNIKIKDSVPLTPAIIIKDQKTERYNSQENISQLKYFTQSYLNVNELSSQESDLMSSKHKIIDKNITNFDALNQSKNDKHTNEENFYKNNYKSNSNINAPVSSNFESLTKNNTTSVTKPNDKNLKKSNLITQIFPNQNDSSSDINQSSTNINQESNETTTTFPTIVPNTNLPQSNKNINEQQEKFNRKFNESEREEFSGSFYDYRHVIF